MTTSRQQPNILLITTDQQRYDALGSTNQLVQTPNLDRLAALGTVFGRGYIQNPVCIPSRACIQTGRYVHQHGVDHMEDVIGNTPGLPPWETTIMERLQQAGYVTAAFGKVHMLPPKGFDELGLTMGKGARWVVSEGSPLGPSQLGPVYAAWLERKHPGAYEALYAQRRQAEYQEQGTAIVVVVVLSLAVAIGITVGALAGYFGGLVDEILMRITEVFLAFPTLILAMAVTATLGPSLFNVMLSLGLVSWPGYARLLRAQILSVKNFTFVEAAHSVGVSPLRILYRHVLPNAITPLVAQVSLDMAGTLLVATGLGFLGMGAQPPTPEWGLMVSSGMAYTLSAWWDPAFAGMAIFLTALCLNALGEYLRDVFAPETTT